MSDPDPHAAAAAAPPHFRPAGLRSLNTFGVDARAERFAVLDDVAHVDALVQALAALRAPAADDGAPPAFVLGAGSNLLLTADVRLPVVQMRLRGRRILPDAGPDGSVRVELAAGEGWDNAVGWTLAHGLAGLENLALIPGTCGAAPVQNIGAYGVELHDVFDELDAVDLRTGTRRTFDRAACRFGYRDSVFKQPDGAHWMITALRLRLQPAERATLRLDYAGLREALGDVPPTPARLADAVRSIRRRKLPDPARIGNAGSFFRNPVLDAADAARLRIAEPGLPSHPVAGHPERVKVPAAWLIEACGLKGLRDGDAGISAEHALVLVNHGTATGAQLLAVATTVQQRVRERFGIVLEPEPVIL